MLDGETVAGRAPDPGANGVPLRDSLLYGFGYVPLALLAGLTGTWLFKFYRPDPNDPEMTVLVSAGAFFAAMTVKSIMDAVTDPLVGYLSDRTRTRWGRRKPYLLVGGPLLAVTTVLLWRPPTPGESVANGIYLGVMAALTFVCFTIVACPYLAMLPEITTSLVGRVKLTTWQGAFNVLGSLIALAGAGVLIDQFGYRGMVLCMAPLILLASWAPLLVKERAVTHEPAGMPFGQAMIATVRNRHFVPYVISQLLFWEALWIVLAAVPKLVEIRAEVSETVQGLIVASSMVAAVGMFPLAPKLTARFGKKKILRAGMVWFGLLMVPLMLIGAGPAFLSPIAQALVVMLLAGPPVATLFSLPNAILADIIDRDEEQTGQRREAMYFGVQGLIVKAGAGIGPGIAGLLLGTFGETATEQGGFTAALIAALLFSLAAAAVLSRYPGD